MLVATAGFRVAIGMRDAVGSKGVGGGGVRVAIGSIVVAASTWMTDVEERVVTTVEVVAATRVGAGPTGAGVLRRDAG